MIGVVQLICDLAEAPTEAFLASALEPDCFHGLEFSVPWAPCKRGHGQIH